MSSNISKLLRQIELIFNLVFINQNIEICRSNYIYIRCKMTVMTYHVFLKMEIHQIITFNTHLKTFSNQELFLSVF